MIQDDLKSVIEKLDISEDKRQDLLKDVYELVDEYNDFVRHMDKKFDKVVSGLEMVTNDED